MFVHRLAQGVHVQMLTATSRPFTYCLRTLQVYLQRYLIEVYTLVEC